MTIFGKLLAAPLKALGIIHTPGKVPDPLAPVQRDDAAAQIAADDELQRRKGGAADLVNGASGAGTPLTGGKLTLGS